MGVNFTFPNRKWNYFSPFSASEQKISFTNCLSMLTEWTYLDLFGPTRTCMDLIDLFGGICTYLKVFGPIWTYMALYGHIWLNLDRFGPIWNYLGLFLPILAQLDPFCGSIWNHFDLFGALWTSLNLSGHIWAPRKTLQPMQDPDYLARKKM